MNMRIRELKTTSPSSDESYVKGKENKASRVENISDRYVSGIKMHGMTEKKLSKNIPSLSQIANNIRVKNGVIFNREERTLYIDQFYKETLSPIVARQVRMLDPSIEQVIEKLESRLLDFMNKEGVKAIKPFAIRGIYCSSLDSTKQTQRAATSGQRLSPFIAEIDESDEVKGNAVTQDFSIEGWRKRGYISKCGGNFFVFHPEKAPESPDDFLYLLFASCGSASRYSMREKYPVILTINMDDKFIIPASGGNDGISGTFPWTFTINNSSFHLYNLDVGCITSTISGLKHKVGLVSDTGVPRSHVAREIGIEGVPPWVQGKKLWDMTENEQLAYGRWVYMNVLQYIIERCVPYPSTLNP